MVVGDAEALKTAELKLRQHAEYNGLDVSKLKVIKIVELNEDLNFIPNVERAERNKHQIDKMPERKNRVVFGG